MTAMDVSGKLGEFMLKGWILTDVVCAKGCNVPLMRSPAGRSPVTYFCAKCDGSPSITAQTDSSTFELPPETEATRRRREQMDRTSAELSQRLLKGWTMLGEECPSDECYGVPLMRGPKTKSNKDSPMECVICGKRFVKEADGLQLVPKGSQGQLQKTTRNTLLNVHTDQDSKKEEKLRIVSQGPGANRSISHFKDLETRNEREPPSVPATLETTVKSLELTLRRLSGRLDSLHGEILDLGLINSIADAISKVTQALSHVQVLQSTQ